jgi:hypothetical protein
MQRGETKAIYCDPPLVGEYITINIPGTYQVLALSEVKVYLSEFKSKFRRKVSKGLLINNSSCTFDIQGVAKKKSPPI